MTTALEIVSPEKLLLSRPVDMVVIPAFEGEMGVLPGHAPMIVLLRGGTIRLYENGQVTGEFFVGGGFAEVTPDRCTVLATEAIPLAEVSRGEGERRLAAAEHEWEHVEKDDVTARDAVLARLQSAHAMIEVAGVA